MVSHGNSQRTYLSNSANLFNKCKIERVFDHSLKKISGFYLNFYYLLLNFSFIFNFIPINYGRNISFKKFLNSFVDFIKTCRILITFTGNVYYKQNTAI